MLFTRAFVALGVAELAYFVAVGLSVYALPLYVTGPLGGGEAQAGLAFGVFAVSALLLRPFAGRIVDRSGRRPLLIGGALLAAVGLVATAYADDLPVLVGLRLLLGVAEAGFVVAAFTVLADVAPESRMGEAISFNSLGLYLGLAFGPPLGELVVHHGGFTTAWWTAGGLAVLGAVIAAVALEESRPAGEPVAEQPLIHRPAIPASISFLTAMVAVGGFLAFAALYAEEIDLARTSLPLLFYGCLIVFCRIFFAAVPDRYDPLVLGGASLGVISAGIAVVALWSEPVGLFVGIALLAVGVSFCTPAFFTAVFASATTAERGAASATASMAIDLGLGIGPIVLGVLADGAGFRWAFALAAAVAASGALWTVLVRTRSAAVPR